MKAYFIKGTVRSILSDRILEVNKAFNSQKTMDDFLDRIKAKRYTDVDLTKTEIALDGDILSELNVTKL
jgi:pentose-5-phosphate-3-epimerase